MTSSPANVQIGERKPRLHLATAYTSSAGTECIDLAARAGLVLDGWQQDVLRDALGERPDGRWSSFENAVLVSRQNGKGSILEARVLAGLLLFGEKLIVWTSHQAKTSTEAFGRIEALFSNFDDIRRRVKKFSHTNGEEGVEMLGGARLRFVARSGKSGRGFSGDLVILDEALELAHKQVDALFPTMSARPNPQVWYTSSPPVDSLSGEVLFGIRRRALDAIQHERDDGLTYYDWGVEGVLDDLKKINLNDLELARRSNPAYNIRITPEFTLKERRALSDEGYARERLGIWPRDLSTNYQVVSEQQWEDALDVKSAIVGTMAFSVDVSPDRQRGTIGSAGRRADGGTHIEVVDARPGTGWIVPRLQKLVERQKPCAIAIDEKGAAGSLIAEAEAAGLAIVKINMTDVARGYALVYDGVAGADESARNLHHIGQPELDEAVKGAMKRTLGDGSAWDRKTSAVDITPLVACSNALAAFAEFGTVAPQQFFAARR